MTVIAAVSQFNGVMLRSDCRVTIKYPGKPDVHSDTAQKLFPVTPTTVIGFSGDVRTASAQLQELFRQGMLRRRKDSISILSWLPRFFKSTYSRLEKQHVVAPVHFMVASVVPGRLNCIERQKVVDLMNKIAFRPSMQRSWMPSVIMDILRSPPTFKYVGLPGTVAGLVYKMASPDFSPDHVAPLEFSAIGSGHQSVVEIKRTEDWVLGGSPGSDFIESTALTSAVEQFIADEQIKDVGGMYPCIKVDQAGIRYLGIRQTLPLYELSLNYDSQRRRWVQENHTTGKKIELLLPWEILTNMNTADRTFNDLREALEDFCPG